MNERTEVCRYPRNKRGQRIGCLYAKINEDRSVSIGWSAYNEDKETRPFSKAIARDIARGRAIKGETANQMPYNIEKQLARFIGVVDHYFPDHRNITVVSGFPSTVTSGELRNDIKRFSDAMVMFNDYLEI